jgi:heme/copper-type cytochrome/quinol oxidase subunit 3
MGLRVYLPVAVAVFLAATTGADLIARTSIGGQPFTAALHEHLYYAAVQFVGTLLLLGPFIAVAFVCARIEKQARDRSVALIFAAAMLTLLYFYFQGYQASERAMLEKMWTAATLSIGLLPFFIEVPVVLTVMGAGALAAKLDRRISS